MHGGVARHGHAGGSAVDADTVLADMLAVDATTGAWAPVACGASDVAGGGGVDPGARSGHAMCLLRGEVLLFGGCGAGNAFASSICDGLCASMFVRVSVIASMERVIA